MWKLGSNRDTRETSENGGETLVEPGRWSREGRRGRINEGIVSIDIMYICENTNVSLNTLYEEGSEPGKTPSAVCVCVTITMNYVMM